MKGIDGPLESTREGNLQLEEVIELAKSMGVEVYVNPNVETFKGGRLPSGEKVVYIPEGSEGEEEDILAGEILHELGHIRFEHFGSGGGSLERFIRDELQATSWALGTKAGYSEDSWVVGILPGIAEDASERFGISLWDAWQVTKRVASKVGTSGASIRKAEEEVKARI